MARKTLQENLVDTELIYAFAKTSMLIELETFVIGSHVANIQNIGERSPSRPTVSPTSKTLIVETSNDHEISIQIYA